jgi:hypothetical protein
MAARLNQQAKDGDRTCRHCGKTMFRKRFGARLEDRSVYRNRIFCGRECMALGMVKPGPKPGTLHWRARRFRDKACEACGSVKALHVHHVDQNPANNDPANLQTLCAICHDFWHAAAKRTDRQIAGRMPTLWASGDQDGTTELRASSQPLLKR